MIHLFFSIIFLRSIIMETSILDPAILSVLVTFILGLLTSVGKVVQIRTKLQAISKVIHEIDVAMADGTITPAETKSIIALFRAVVK